MDPKSTKKPVRVIRLSKRQKPASEGDDAAEFLADMLREGVVPEAEFALRAKD